jgi:hypothetical protein
LREERDRCHGHGGGERCTDARARRTGSSAAGARRSRGHLEHAHRSGVDTVPTNVVVTAGADAASWSMKLPSGETTKVEPVVAGDSVVLTSGTFGSIRRKGAKVSTVSTLRLQEGKLVGTTIAHYKNAGADSVLRMTAVATKAP